jgi:RNA polymerase sigma-70 factor (ECF subfamily)
MPTSTDPHPPVPADAARWFAAEVQPHDAALRAFVRGSFPRERDVEDVVQESYLRLCRARTAQPIRSARALLFTIARHVALSRVEWRRVSPEIAVGDLAALPTVAEEGHDAAQAAARGETLRLLAEALAELPPRCREITILRKLQGVPQRDIAARLGVAEKTVEEQVSRGVKRCEAYLRARGVTNFLSR